MVIIIFMIIYSAWNTLKLLLTGIFLLSDLPAATD